LRVLGPIPKDGLFNAALVPTFNLQPSTSNQNVWQPAPITEEWTEDAVVEWPGTLSLPADLPGGDYRLAVTLQAADGSIVAEFAISEKDPPIRIESSK
jgi:hypothetical protein